MHLFCIITRFWCGRQELKHRKKRKMRHFRTENHKKPLIFEDSPKASPTKKPSIFPTRPGQSPFTSLSHFELCADA